MRTEKQNWKVIYAEMANTRRAVAVEKAPQEAPGVAPKKSGTAKSKPPLQSSWTGIGSMTDDTKTRWNYWNNGHERDGYET